MQPSHLHCMEILRFANFPGVFDFPSSFNDSCYKICMHVKKSSICVRWIWRIFNFLPRNLHLSFSQFLKTLCQERCPFYALAHFSKLREENQGKINNFCIIQQFQCPFNVSKRYIDPDVHLWFRVVQVYLTSP